MKYENREDYMEECIYYFEYCDVKRLSKIELENDQVHVWKIRWEEIRAWIYESDYLLTVEEKKRANAYLHEADRKRYITGKILSKIIIGHYLDVQPSEIQYHIDKYGKPHARLGLEKVEIEFNISHSGAWVFMAFSRNRKVGIDVEEIKEMEQYMGLAQTIFEAKEYEFLKGENNISAFYHIWTAKESYIKALGYGLSKDLKSFSVINTKELRKAWLLVPLEVQGYAAHLAVRR